MKLNKRQTYIASLAVGVLLCLLYQSIWIFSRTATAKISNTDAYVYKGSKINLIHATYQVDYKSYDGAYLRDGYDTSRHFLKIRYLIFAPGVSRTDSFVTNWGPLIMFFILFSLITSIVFIRKDIIDDQAVFLVQARQPYISIENNEIKDYDEHDIINEKLSETEEILRTKLKAIESQADSNNIRTSVYKYNPNAIAIIVVYIFYLFWFVYSTLTLAFGGGEIILYGAITVSIPMYIRNTNNPVFKMKIPDAGTLIFSPAGIEYDGYLYPVAYIESAVVYLEAFNGFEYRERITTGLSKAVSSGDNNKISFLFEGDASDVTFLLDRVSDYWALKHLMGKWSTEGIPVVLMKVFEDDFIIQEMVHFHTAAN